MTITSRRWGSSAAALVLTAAASVAVVTVGAQSAPADTGAACSAVYSIGWQTPSNSPPDFGATVTVTNNAPYTISTWTISWTFTAGQTIIPGSPFSATVAQTGTAVTATPGGTFNAVLAPGATASWGFHGTYNGTSNPVPALACTGPSEGIASATLSGPLDPLGVNTAAWDTNFTDSAVAGDLSAASTGLIRYPGGSWADQYLWQPNTVNGSVQPVNFAQYSTQVDAIGGGQKFVTLDYGSDTAASAGAWAKQAATTPGQGVGLWEVGNEVYGSWETDTHANPHTAASYATNALPYMQAVKAADPKAQMCYPYGMDGGLAPGSGVDNWQSWNSTILQADAAAIDCADVHWYPINGIPAENVQSIMELVDNIPAAAAEVKSALAANDPKAYFVVGETNMSQTANAWNEEPVGALFSAANALEWLANGAQSVDWWDVHNYGTATADFGLFSSATGGEPAIDTPNAPYYGYQLASKLAVAGAKVSTLTVPAPNVYAYASSLPNGSYAVLLANADPANPAVVSTASLGITSPSETEYSYSAAQPSITTGAFTGTSLSLPAQSVVVLTGGSGVAPSGSPSASASASAAASASPSPSASATSASPSASPSTSPSVSASASTSPSASATGSGSPSCQVTWSVTNMWNGGFQLAFTVADNGTVPINGWVVSFTWPGAQTVSQIWNATVTQSGASVTIPNLNYNGTLAPGSSATFGLIGSGQAPTSLPNLRCTAH
jgi:hypothetical protein